MTDDRLAEDRIVKQPSAVGVVRAVYWIDRDPKDAAPGAWIGVDFDGTLAHYDGWRGMATVGAPIPAMVERVKAALARGWIVKIVTARVCAGQTDDDLALAHRVLDAWCEEVFGHRLTLTAEKDFKMIELWDDRCVQVITNTGQPAVERAIAITTMAYEAVQAQHATEKGASGDGDYPSRPVGFPD